MTRTSYFEADFGHMFHSSFDLDAVKLSLLSNEEILGQKDRGGFGRLSPSENCKCLRFSSVTHQCNKFVQNQNNVMQQLQQGQTIVRMSSLSQYAGAYWSYSKCSH
jgi:hypothetical protein